MDVIALFKANVSNAIALMGTAFTKEHLKTIRFLGVDVVLSLDGDFAGKTATRKLATVLENENIKISIVSDYEDVKDADEYFNKYGANKLLLKVQNPITFFEFNINEMKNNPLLENFEERKKFANQMCHYLASKDDIEIDYYVNRLALELKFSKQTLLNLIKKEKQANPTEVVPSNYVTNKRLLKRNEKYKSEIIFQMLQSNEAIDEFNKEDVYYSMPDDYYRQLAMYILDYYLENNEINEADLYSYISNLNPNDDEILKTLTQVISSHNENESTYNKDYFHRLIYYIKEIMTLEQRIDQLKEKLAYTSDNKEVGNIANEIFRLSQELKQKSYNFKK